MVASLHLDIVHNNSIKHKDKGDIPQNRQKSLPFVLRSLEVEMLSTFLLHLLVNKEGFLCFHLVSLHPDLFSFTDTFFLCMGLLPADGTAPAKFLPCCQPTLTEFSCAPMSLAWCRQHCLRLLNP